MSETITDAKGRKLTLRTLNVLEQVKLLRAIGPAQSNNEPYVNVVQMAASVSDIDGVPQPIPTNEAQIDAAIARVGDDGFAVLMADMRRKIAAMNDAAEAALAGGGVAPDPLAPSA